MLTRPVIRRTRSRGRGAGSRKRKAEKEPQTEAAKDKKTAKTAKKEEEDAGPKDLKNENSEEKEVVEKEVVKKKEDAKPAKSKAKKQRSRTFEAALRPKKNEAETYYLKDLKIIFAQSEKERPARFVECVNFHKEDIFGNGGENLNKGFDGMPCIYLLPLWTKEKELANVTGFQLVASNTEDPSRTNLYTGIPGVFVYLMPTFDPNINERIIGLQLFRSRQYNPPRFGWSNTTTNINEGRGGDHLCLQWDLGTEQDVPGRKFRFAFWRR